METLYTYADQLVSETWVTWVEQLLSTQAEKKFNTSRGFQDRHGSANANERTRALELWSVGLLRGPLVTPQSGNRDVAPLGWKLVVEGNSPLTALGYMAYGLGKAMEKQGRASPIRSAFSTLCAIFVLQMHVGHKDRSILTSSAFLHLRAHWQVPSGISAAKWNRYLAAVLFCTLTADAKGVLSDFATNSLTANYVLAKETGATAVDLEKLAGLVEGSYSISDVRPAKPSLYWVGDPSSEEPRGVFSLAAEHTQYLLEAALEIDKRAALEGSPSPFMAAWPRDGDLETPVTLEVLEKAFAEGGFSSEWERAMKSLKKGVLESLRYLEGDANEDGRRLHYVHGWQLQGQPPTKLEIEVAANKCTAVPKVGDHLETPLASYVVRKAVRTDDKWTVLVERE